MDILEIKSHNNLECLPDHLDIFKRINSDISYWHFFDNYLLPNRPCILSNIGKNWVCLNQWIKNGAFDLELFRERYGKSEVPVADCGKRTFNVQEKFSTSVEQYLEYWKDVEGRSSCLYLKDWHFTKDYPTENVYRVPPYFASDWLNEYYTDKRELDDDYRFLYLGPKGSWTPLHADVFTSYSWSFNVFGRKKWLLIRPGSEKYFQNSQGSLMYDISSSDLKEKISQGAQTYEIIQEEGEAIFVPSGWHHQVWNLEDTLSINHNWINGCNIHFMWDSLKKNLLDVKKEISDCRDIENWTEQCQIVLKASYGFNYSQFFSFLTQIACSRIDALNNGKPLKVYGDWSFGHNHLIFDLKRIKDVLKSFVIDEDVLDLEFVIENKGSLLPTKLLEQIEDTIYQYL